MSVYVRTTYARVRVRAPYATCVRAWTGARARKRACLRAHIFCACACGCTRCVPRVTCRHHGHVHAQSAMLSVRDKLPEIDMEADRVPEAPEGLRRPPAPPSDRRRAVTGPPQPRTRDDRQPALPTAGSAKRSVRATSGPPRRLIGRLRVGRRPRWLRRRSSRASAARRYRGGARAAASGASQRDSARPREMPYRKRYGGPSPQRSLPPSASAARATCLPRWIRSRLPLCTLPRDHAT